MPNMDDGVVSGVSDCYVLASLVDSDTNTPLAGTSVLRTTTRKDSLDPTWFTFVSFPVAAHPSDVLKLDVYDEDLLRWLNLIVSSLQLSQDSDFDPTRCCSKDDHIGSALEAVGTLAETGGAPVTSTLMMATKIKPKNHQASTVTVRHVSTVGAENTEKVSPTPFKKTVFLIRHGESKWNEAQAAKHVGHMLKQYDHELDAIGIEQACAFNAKWKGAREAAGGGGGRGGGGGGGGDDSLPAEAAGGGGGEGSATASPPPSAAEAAPSSPSSPPSEAMRLEEFLSAGAIYASPLTRATQTALLTCQDHPFFAGGGELKLCRAVREVKSTPMGSLDTVGEKKGDEIAAHVAKCLTADGKGAGLDVDRVMAPKIVPRDATDHWWTSLDAKDTKEQMKVRFRDAFTVLRHDTDAPVVILVGHSLFFRNLVRAHLSEPFKEAHPDLARDLHAKKLDNAACLRCELEWPPPGSPGGADPMAPPQIVHAELVFGSGFHEHHHSHPHSHDVAAHTDGKAQQPPSTEDAGD